MTERRWWRCAGWLLAAGALLRGLLIWFPRAGDDDTDVYAELGRNLLRHGTYGIMVDGEVGPSLFRLPGYPLVLAILGTGWGVLAVQSAVDLLGCVLLGLTVRRFRGDRAGLWTVALGALCLFLAVYAAIPLTESLSVFAVSLAIWGLGVVIAATDRVAWQGVGAMAGAAGLAMILRPDGVLLACAGVVGLGWYGTRRLGWRRAAVACVAFGCLAMLPLVPWTVRNARTFHQFQPLAPRHVNDPGERVNLGFYRWMRTWACEFADTGEVYWKVGTEPIEMADVPARAFDSDTQRAQTAALLARYNVRRDLDQNLDDAFGRLAAERVEASPLRYYAGLPGLRVADMMMRPRTDGWRLQADWRLESAGMRWAAVGLGLLNLLYVGLALAGVRRAPGLVFLVAYLAMRCVLLGGVENAEPRYTLELYPVVVLCAGCWGRWGADRKSRIGVARVGVA